MSPLKISRQVAKSQFSPLISHLSPLISHLSPLISHLSSLISHLSSLTSNFFPLSLPFGKMSAGQRGFFFISYPTLSGASHADKSAVVATSVNLSASPDLTALTPAFLFAGSPDHRLPGRQGRRALMPPLKISRQVAKSQFSSLTSHLSPLPSFLSLSPLGRCPQDRGASSSFLIRRCQELSTLTSLLSLLHP